MKNSAVRRLSLVLLDEVMVWRLLFVEFLMRNGTFLLSPALLEENDAFALLELFFVEVVIENDTFVLSSGHFLCFHLTGMLPLLLPGLLLTVAAAAGEIVKSIADDIVERLAPIKTVSL